MSVTISDDKRNKWIISDFVTNPVFIVPSRKSTQDTALRDWILHPLYNIKFSTIHGSKLGNKWGSEYINPEKLRSQRFLTRKWGTMCLGIINILGGNGISISPSKLWDVWKYLLDKLSALQIILPPKKLTFLKGDCSAPYFSLLPSGCFAGRIQALHWISSQQKKGDDSNDYLDFASTRATIQCQHQLPNLLERKELNQKKILCDR